MAKLQSASVVCCPGLFEVTAEFSCPRIFPSPKFQGLGNLRKAPNPGPYIYMPYMRLFAFRQQAA